MNDARKIVSMNKIIILSALLIMAPDWLKAQSLPESDFAHGLEWAGVACVDTNYTLWGASPILSDDGSVHLFIARWPQTNVDPAWRRYSEIAHYVGDHPEGPFVFSDVALQGTGTNTWDKYAPHNPEIHYYEGLYVLLYIANSDYHQPPHPLNQQIGMATATSLDGPWTKVGTDGLLLGPSSDPSHYTYGRQIVNPALLKVGNTYHLYFKTGMANGQIAYGVATSTSVTGPYTLAASPITSPGFIEDAVAFMQDGKVCLLTTDLQGHVTGLAGAGALFKSDDGLTFDMADTEVGYYPIPDHYADYDPANVNKIFYWVAGFQRPPTAGSAS